MYSITFPSFFCMAHHALDSAQEIFHRTPFPGGLTFPWPASDARRIRGYTELEVELALDCKAG